MEMSSMRQESEMDMQTIEEPPRSRWRSLAVELKIQKLSKQSTKSYLRFCRRASQQRSAGLPPPGPMRPPVPDLTEVRTSAEIKFLFQETILCIKEPIFPFARCTDHSTPRRGDTSSQETRHPGQLILGNTSIEKKRFLSGIARNEGGGGSTHARIFLALFLEVHFWSIKRVYFFKNANVLNF